MFYDLAYHKQLAFERIVIRTIPAAADEYLAHDRLDLFDALAKAGTIHRHIAPAQQLLAFVRDLFFDDLLARCARSRIARQKQHPDAIFSGGRQLDLAPAHLISQKLIWYLQQDAGTVTGQRIGPHRTAMGQVFKYLQALQNHVMALFSLDMGHKAHAAGITLLAWIV